MTKSDFDDDDDDEKQQQQQQQQRQQANSNNNKTSPFNFNRYKVLDVTVHDYSWNILDLLDNNKKKLLFRVKANRHIRLLKVLDKINHENVWKWNLYRDEEKYFAIESQDYYQLNDSLWIQMLKNKNQGTLIDEAQIVQWIKQLLLAVACLHQNLILIQRIDPFIRLESNRVLVNVDWDSEVLKSKDELIYQTQQDVKFKSPEYLETSMIGLKYDIWCVGWLLYSLCTLNDPHSSIADSINKDQQQKSNNNIKWNLPSLPNDVTDELKDLYKLMTNLNEKERPHADELLKMPLFNRNSKINNNNINNDDENDNEDPFKIGKIFARRYKLVKEVKQNLKWIFQDLKETNQIKQAYLVSDLSACKRNLFEKKLVHSFIQSWDHLEIKSHFIFIKPIFRTKLSTRLEEFKEKRNLVGEKLVLNWIKKLVSVLNYLHLNNIIHTWINPREIGFENDELKLSMSPDVQCINSSTDSVKINQLDIFYNCPEYWLNDCCCINLKYDVWSLGWTLYQICTLDNYIIIWLEKLKKFSDTAHPVIPKYYSDELRSLFLRMTDYDPDQRPTANQLLEDRIFEF